MAEGARKRNVVVRLGAALPRRLRGHHTGSLVGRDERGPLVDYPGNPHGVLVARTTVALDAAPLGSEPAASREVLLVFEQERSDEPIIVGLLEPKGAPALPPVEAKSLAAKVDGRRVVIDAEDEIELRCGEASITLRRNGRVVIRGAYVETRARGVNRIKGGAVQIN